MDTSKNTSGQSIILSTWHFGYPANQSGWEAFERGGGALDSVEAVARHAEADTAVTSVGIGGLPDATGIVTLDAAIMDGNGNAGAVSFMRVTTHAISVARAVMERTPHVMLAGEGADAFARSQGFPMENLLTPESRAKFEEHKGDAKIGTEMPNEEPWAIKPTDASRDADHDTIGVVARDQFGKIAAACTTSGLAWKMHGRVGDSPILGSGLYADITAGAAVGTGTGELIMKVCGSFLIVELMRQGWEPLAACMEAVRRIRALDTAPDMQAGFIALRSDGEYGTACLRTGFEYAVRTRERNELLASSPFIPV